MITAEDFKKHLKTFEDHIASACDERVNDYIENRIREAMKDTVIVKDEFKSPLVSYAFSFNIDSVFDHVLNAFEGVSEADRKASVKRVTNRYADEGGWIVTTHDKIFTLSADSPKGQTVWE